VTKETNHKFFSAQSSSWIGPAVIALLFVFSAALTWRKWADIIVDFGMQLYVPWRISEGDVLYRDVMYLPGGPFSQHFNALLFKVFGVSFRTLIFANLAITAGMLVLIYRQFCAATNRLTATTIAAIIVVGFAFANYGDGNYNYVTPYCHEALHGLALSVLAISLLTNWLRRPRSIFIWGAGFCYGTVFLTKPEMFLALSAATLAAFVLIFKSSGKISLLAKLLGIFSIAAAIAPLFFLFYFLRVENLHDSLRSTAFAWVPVLQHSFAANPYYKEFLGLDHPRYNLWKMIWQTALFAVVALAGAAFCRHQFISSREKILALAAGATLLAFISAINWMNDLFLPPLTFGICALLWFNAKKLADRFAFPFLWSVFGLMLLAKMGLFSRIWHYGFILGMPAFVAMVYLLLWLLPFLLEKYGVQRAAFGGMAWWVVFFIGLQLSVSSLVHAQKMTFAVGVGGDRIYTADTTENQRGRELAAAMNWLDANVPRTDTLAVLPEGAMVNYLSRRANPTRCPVWIPPELEAFGQTNMINSFEQHRPDEIMLVQRPVTEYGLKYFGEQPEYGLALMQWIRQNYEVKFQNDPKTSHFGLQIFERRENAK
jgi:hypothetical protein